MTKASRHDAPSAALKVLQRNLSGEPQALTSVCSAHPLVLRASAELARDHGQVALIEATCNQVNQEGGYTGMKPADFADRARAAARDADLPEGRLLLGGDHLGPQPWKALPAEEAMARAEAMVALYVEAGFAKIHLDCSMRCGDDPEILPEQTIADRAARLCAAAEAANGQSKPFYVIGTEVPAPGGMGEGHEIVPTTPEAASATWQTHADAFATAGLSEAFQRVAGIVVQPGLDFGNDTMEHFAPEKARGLTDAAAGLGGLVYEAHSTDYQLPEAYKALVAGHFAILKVGPAATFALREALYALELIEAEITPAANRSGLRAAMEAAMLANPVYWESHYGGEAATQAWLRHFSWSDRLRYYWTVPEVDAAVQRLEANLAMRIWPLPLVGQFLPEDADAISRGHLAPTVPDVAIAHIRRALTPYFQASTRHDPEGTQ
ncbi:tagatose-bisphosphate aldolase noncatalytic subunit [Aliiruegeria haliotis]|uniref:Tagatose-bisphosphate aldolase noncatalytic subunit n=1 Tax=Aliiruegeria haliotis TaxID=1280846 RepID=A0A2T0REA1_9RHOB|nr:class II D-tagatose-bisphosphate aldolase, non-catalytic subunit [Aliiruegeria haliotis]PRY19524.1 tagatose-bisphosphate aldolase noncatalytic subunit [Aliiruegeria haliotis]